MPYLLPILIDEAKKQVTLRVIAPFGISAVHSKLPGATHCVNFIVLKQLHQQIESLGKFLFLPLKLIGETNIHTGFYYINIYN